MTRIEDQKITLFRGYLVTCNDDGSIPLSAQTLCCVAQEMTPVLQLLIDRWNQIAVVGRPEANGVELTNPTTVTAKRD